MPSESTTVSAWLFAPSPAKPGRLWPRWLWLRALGLIFFSAFYSFAFQVRGLIGRDGILPAHDYLDIVRQQIGGGRYWLAPTLLWLNSSDGALVALWIAGMAAAILLVLNVWPRASIAVCFVAYLSIISVAQDFASYQSDGMLLAAAFLSLFVVPGGLRPGLGENWPPSRAGLFMLQWLWLQIYFESGVVKLASHDPQWRNLTALDHYYQNGPLPDWIGWYAQQLPHGFQAAIVLVTLATELGLVWLMFLPRRFRLACFLIVTPFQVGIILTANLAFLNYLVLALGIWLLDDGYLDWAWARLPGALRRRMGGAATPVPVPQPEILQPALSPEAAEAPPVEQPAERWSWQRVRDVLSIFVPAVVLTWVFYATLVGMIATFGYMPALPMAPVAALEPLRIADHYGLFAVMTSARFEVEFQGSRDGKNWVAYPFRYKPQRIDEAPRLYAPYQPRFDWNLWFASLATWRQYPWVIRAEALLLRNDATVLGLFAGNPFAGSAPTEVRAVVWEYSFTDLTTKRATGAWWWRDFKGLYGPVVDLGPDGRARALEWPGRPPGGE